ncbi:caspase family protein [Dactylosporangium sp. NPDC049742]|uniref:caspase family protein n=1 Tax=Dactylosporangium sp. NPDC049742 TaxID=3154737 RepID=UPI0034332FBC
MPVRIEQHDIDGCRKVVASRQHGTSRGGRRPSPGRGVHSPDENRAAFVRPGSCQPGAGQEEAGSTVMGEKDSFAASRAILIGVAAYDHADLTQLPAVRASLRAMERMLTDPALCGWPADRVTVIADPVSAADLGARVADLAEETSGELLLYFAGHGMLGERGELFLTTKQSRPTRLPFTALPWPMLADVVRNCPAAIRVVILDCCYAGRATETLAGGADIADLTHVQGAYTLTATTRNSPARTPVGADDTVPTSFTGVFAT